MSGKFFKSCVPAVLLILFCHCSGCGPARPYPHSETTPTVVAQPKGESSKAEENPPGLARSLGMRILSESAEGSTRSHRDFRKPDPKTSLDTASPLDFNAKMEGNQISYGKVFPIADPNSPNPEKRRELFFVWPETSLGSSIIEAGISHKILDGGNRWVGVLPFTPATYDSDHHRWFVPVSSLFKDLSSPFVSINEADTQVMTLELLLANTSKVMIEVRFRATRV